MNPPTPSPAPGGDWPARQRAWQRRLPRLRLDAEPIPEQLDRDRRSTIALTILATTIGTLFLVLFSAFGAPVLGGAIGLGFSASVALPAWGAHLRMKAGADRYLRERREARVESPAADSSPAGAPSGADERGEAGQACRGDRDDSGGPEAIRA